MISPISVSECVEEAHGLGELKEAVACLEPMQRQLVRVARRLKPALKLTGAKGRA